MKHLLLLSALLFSMLSFTAQNAPIDFEAAGNGADWTWTVFENDDNPPLLITDNPAPDGVNGSATAAQFTARVGGNPWAGCESLHGADIGPFVLDETNSLIKIMVYKTTISDVGIKLVQNNSAALPEIKIPNTLVDQWEEITFDFSAQEGPEYDQIVIFMDFTFDPRPEDNISYFDNISFSSNVAPVPGCTDPEATNYDPEANVDDQSCVYPCPSDITGDGVIDVNDFIQLNSDFGSPCD